MKAAEVKANTSYVVRWKRPAGAYEGLIEIWKTAFDEVQIENGDVWMYLVSSPVLRVDNDQYWKIKGRWIEANALAVEIDVVQ